MRFSPCQPLEFPYAVCKVAPVEEEAVRAYRSWIASGRHGDMGYLERYDDIRANPALLLEGARTMVIVAFPYFTDEEIGLPISLYARGRDYHEEVRERLRSIAESIDGETRLCVDTAPLRERYWAARAGLGRIGRNNQLIVPGLGSYCFIGTVLTTADLDEERPFRFDSPDPCGDCRRCESACPGRCIDPEGRAIDAQRCVSYLTIEHRGPLPQQTPRLTSVYGCDVCQRVCPHNRGVAPTPIGAFHPSERLRALTAESVTSMTQVDFSATFAHSAIKRTKLAGLQRNNERFKKDTETAVAPLSRR